MQFSCPSGAALASGGLCVVAALTPVGCVSSGLSPLHFGVRRVKSADKETLFQAAESALIAAGYEIETSDPQAGIIRTQPRPVPREEAYRRSRQVAGTPPRLRRVARVHVEQSGEVVSVYCRVVVQEQTTEAHRMFWQEREFSDLPGETPLEREGATTVEQNTVWRTMERDKTAERHILDTIFDEPRAWHQRNKRGPAG